MAASGKAAPPPGSPGWWLARRIEVAKRRPRRNGLTMERINAAALEVLEREGVEALTMRRVAQKLGTGPASLYNHVGSLEELRVELIDHVLGLLPVQAPPDGDWRERAAWAARTMRRHLLDHLSVVPLLVASQQIGPNSMLGREFGLQVALEAGLRREEAVCAYLAITHFIFAVVQQDIRRAARNQTERKALRRLFASLDPQQFPTIVECADELAAHDSDEEFEFGLQALLDRAEALAGKRTDA